MNKKSYKNYYKYKYFSKIIHLSNFFWLSY